MCKNVLTFKNLNVINYWILTLMTKLLLINHMRTYARSTGLIFYRRSVGLL